MKRKTEISWWKLVVFGCMLFAGVQNAIAACAGTLHFKKPDDWPRNFYIAMNNIDALVTASYYNAATGYYEYDLADAGGENIETSFAIESAKTAPMNYILSNVWNGLSPNDQSYPKNNRNIRCPGAGKDVYVLENPKKANTTLVTNTEPDIKYFYVLVPDDEAWKSTVPMWSGDGTFASGQPLKVDPNMCGWYYAVWMDEPMPEQFIIFKDDDVDLEDAIGMGGWEAEVLEPFPMDMFFSMYDPSKKIYFIADSAKAEEEGVATFSVVDPMVKGNCEYKLAAFLYDTDASLHGAFTCDAYPTVASNGCYSASAEYNYTGAGQANTVPCIGVTTGIVNSILDPATKKPTYNASSGCFVSAEAFNVMFEETAGVNVKHCRDVIFSQTKDGMWEYDSYNEPAGAFTPLNDLATDPTCTGTCAIAATLRPGKGNVRYGVGEQGKTAAQNGISRKAQLALGNVTDWSAIEPTTGFPYIDLYPVSDGEFSSGTEPNVYDNTTWDLRIENDNNQMFCFESHANFTYRSGMQFMFRGDDDIWVFIDNKLAVDLGGTHLAAPGYVKLDTLKGSSGNLLTPGETYDIDIFFCDRRTDMSNVRIKTNMYIQQKTAISAKGKKVPGNPSETDYTLCFTRTGDGSCDAAAAGIGEKKTYCGDSLAMEIAAGRIKATYTLVSGKKNGENVVPGFDNVSTPGIYKGGIDLTNFGLPKIDKAKLTLAGGYYTLFVNIEGKSAKVLSFKASGEVDVIYKNGRSYVFDDETGTQTQTGVYNLQTTAMGGDYVPVYISNVASSEGSDELEIYPEDAVEMPYTLAYTSPMSLFEKRVDPTTGQEGFAPIVPGTQRKIGASGVDTVYAHVDIQDLQTPITPFKINVSGRDQNALTIYFYLPQIYFVEKIPEEGETAVAVQGQSKKPDGSYDEYWVGSIYEMYLAIFKPNPDGSITPCLEECNNVYVYKGSETSPKIDFIPEDPVYFVNGYATISVRSLTKYRWDLDPAIHRPATIVAQYNDYVKAVYSPMYFRDPPVPFPVLADVFDARGSLPTLEHRIPAPYFSMQQEYLDGIGDSVAVYYDRRIHKDSLPTKICVMWDSATAEPHNPYAEGLSTMPKDSAITCNVLVPLDASNIDCSAPSDSGYCTNVIMVGGLKLSEEIKTAGIGKVHSFAEFEDKGKKVKQGFDGALTDRMAPVPLRAEVRTLKEGDQLSDLDSLVVIMSEPVKLLTATNKKTALDFYLNSAIELDESSRYVSALAGATAVVTAQIEPSVSVVDGLGRIRYMYSRGNVSPHVGDYVRLGGDLTNVFWSDTAAVNPTGSNAETLRSAADAAYHWNSPTSYNETKRLPSMWIPVTGDAEIAVNENKFASTGNAPAGEKVPPVTVHGYRTTMTKAEILAEEGGKPGHIVKADMYALYNGLSDEERKKVSPQDVYFYYEVQYYTNLGNFVASKTQRIYCDDSKNTEIDPVTKQRIQYFNGGLCTDAGMDRNFFIGWNMRSNKGRTVGTGAYIVKLKSYVKLGSSGKEAKQESTSVWGVKRSPKADLRYMKNTTAK